MCVKLPPAEPLYASLLGYYCGGISPLWRSGDQRGGNGWAAMVPSSCRSRRVEQRKTPIMANQCGREARWQRRLGFSTAGVDYPCGKLPNFRKQCRIGRVSSDLFWEAFFHADETETERGKEVGRRCFFEAVGSVVALPEAAPLGLRKTNIGEDIARRGHCGRIGIAFSSADLPVERGE